MGGKDVTPKDVVVETEQDKQALENAKKRWITSAFLESMQVKPSPSQKIVPLLVRLVTVDRFYSEVRQRPCLVLR